MIESGLHRSPLFLRSLKPTHSPGSLSPLYCFLKGYTPFYTTEPQQLPASSHDGVFFVGGVLLVLKGVLIVMLTSKLCFNGYHGNNQYFFADHLSINRQ